MFDGEVALAPPAVEEALATLPARRGLALLLAEGGRAVLLLPAADVRARVTGRLKNPDEQERRRLPDLQAITRTILWRLATSHFESDLRFLEIARRLWPDAYEEMLGWKPAWFIRVDLRADYPYFARTQDVCSMGVPPMSSSVYSVSSSSLSSSSPANADAERSAGATPAPPIGEMPSGCERTLPCSAETEAAETEEAAEEEEEEEEATEGKMPSGRKGETPSPRETSSPRVRCFGPFPSGSAAQKFIDGLADAFRLCRDVRCLRQSPRGRRCSYGQMGKCLCPCDGTIAAADYARAVAEAAEFVAELRPGGGPAPAGAPERRPLAAKLHQEMRQAAERLQFERAAEIRAQLQRLAELDGPDYAYVAPLEEFRFLLVQRGEGRREKKLSAFLADCGSIRAAGAIEYPLKAERLQRLADAALGCRACNLAPQGRVARGAEAEVPRATSCTPYPSAAADPATTLGVDRWAMGLVAHYLFAGPRRRGVILPVRAGLSAEGIAAGIETSAEALGLKRATKGPSES